MTYVQRDIEHRSNSAFRVGQQGEGKVAKFCKQGRYCDRIGAGTPIFVAAVLEYLTAEIIEIAAGHLSAENAGRDKKKTRITPRHIMLAIKSDPELNEFFRNANFCGAGVVPTAQTATTAGRKKAKKIVDTESEDSDCDMGMQSDSD